MYNLLTFESVAELNGVRTFSSMGFSLFVPVFTVRGKAIGSNVKS